MQNRRKFLKQSALGAGALMIPAPFKSLLPGNADIQLSLAEWSFHRALQSGKMDHLDFPRKAKEDFGISAVEYVNGFFGGKKMNFKEAGKSTPYLNELLKRSKDAGVFNHLIMCDNEGPLAALDSKQRIEAVDNHKKWIDAAKFLGCLTVRVNLHGEDGDPDEKRKVSVESLNSLGEFAQALKINVVVENHGGVTSNAKWLTSVIKEVNRTNVGTLPDFGNFCISHAWGTIQDGCKDMYDVYIGVEEMLPYAKGVSAKAYDFDANGQQPLLDYKRLLGIVKKSGFNGYIGIEFEGNSQPEEEGVRKTKSLVQKYL